MLCTSMKVLSLRYLLGKSVKENLFFWAQKAAFGNRQHTAECHSLRLGIQAYQASSQLPSQKLSMSFAKDMGRTGVLCSLYTSSTRGIMSSI